MPYAPAFQRFFDKHLQPLLSDPSAAAGREQRVIKLLQDYYSSMPTRQDRAAIYKWLGLMHSNLATEAFQDRDLPAAKENHALMEEFYLKSLDEDPNQIEVRYNLAQHYLHFLGDAERALAMLVPAEQEGPLADRPTALEELQHHRLILRGVSLLILGRKSEGLAELQEAYGPRFRATLRHNASTAPLQQLVIRDVTLTAEQLAPLIEALRACGAPQDELHTIERQLRTD